LKVSREQAEQNREALVVAARRLFRRHGFAQVTVSDIADAAGLTHGAFYSHFKAKRDIEGPAIASLIEKAAEDWRQVVLENGDDALPALVDGYLTFDHLSEGDIGCAFAALGAELARADDRVQAAAATALPLQIDVLAKLFSDADQVARRARALAAYAALVGAATISRALGECELAVEFNASTADQILRLRSQEAKARR
jgi:TetR/AcrR family transcriptional repressor of nem operon